MSKAIRWTRERAIQSEHQLSLFESSEPESSPSEASTKASTKASTDKEAVVKKPTMVDLLRYRFENDEIPQEDYKKWIRFLVQSSFKTIR